ncbi:MAG: DUF4259 domain-containing protein [Chitinophagaceae bacterium]|nr:DUF4259 domain-containing protein [Chitinophagaceae bacterium]
MGTWSVNSFGNDSAGDWIIDLLENPTYDFIRETLLASMAGERYTLLNENAIAAAEVICIINGIKSTDKFYVNDYEQVSHNLEPAIENLKQQVMPRDLKELALASISDIEKESELKEMWEDDEEWIAAIIALKERLSKII